MPVIRDYSPMSDKALEALLRERAFKIDAELRTESVPDGWRAAFQVYNAMPTELAPQGASRYAVEAPTKREALIALALMEDQERLHAEWKASRNHRSDG